MTDFGTIYLVEFGCQDLSGHRCNGVEALATALKRAGFVPRVGVNQNACESILERLAAVPAFSLKTWPAFSVDPICGPIETFLEYGALGTSELHEFLGATSARDTIILYTASENELFALANWYAQTPEPLRPKLIANVSLPQFFDWTTEAINLHGRLFRTAIRKMNHYVSPPRRRYITLTDEMARIMKTISGVNYMVPPNPICLSDFVTREAPKLREGPLKVAAPGSPKGSKGAELIPALADRIKDANITLRAQNWPPSHEPPSHVELVAAAAPRAEYVEYVKGCDVTILPYDPGFYRFGVSAVFDESASAGHAVCSVRGTWMADQIRAGRVQGYVHEHGDVEALAADLIELAFQKAALRDRAASAGQDWCRTRGSDVYVEQLSDFLRA